jgi:threonine dehydratase
LKFGKDHPQKPQLHPFESEHMIEGNGSIAIEIMNDMKEDVDFVFVPVGGGGLVNSYLF